MIATDRETDNPKMNTDPSQAQRFCVSMWRHLRWAIQMHDKNKVTYIHIWILLYDVHYICIYVYVCIIATDRQRDGGTLQNYVQCRTLIIDINLQKCFVPILDEITVFRQCVSWWGYKLFPRIENFKFWKWRVVLIFEAATFFWNDRFLLHFWMIPRNRKCDFRIWNTIFSKILKFTNRPNSIVV